MAGRRTNLALLVLLAAAVATGALAYATGMPWGQWVLVAHGAAGLAILLLAPWKSVIARRGLRRERPGSRASVVFAVLVSVAIAFGILHATGAALSFAGVPTLSIHVGAALVSIPFAVWHVWARRVRARPTDISRRNVLRAGALLGAAGVTYAVVEGLVRLTGLRGSDRRFTGSFETGTDDPAAMPVTQWLNDDVPIVDGSTWRLTVATATGERAWTLDELSAFDDRVRATIDCTGGWFAEQDWEGVALSRLLPEIGEARSVLVRSVTGYARRFPVRDVPALLVATRVGDQALAPGHGFPARLVAPGRRGFWWVKWIDRIELSPTPWWWQSPFPLS